jgi:hypothetical protein
VSDLAELIDRQSDDAAAAKLIGVRGEKPTMMRQARELGTAGLTGDALTAKSLQGAGRNQP